MQSTLSRGQKEQGIRRRHRRAYVIASVACAVPTSHHMKTWKPHAFHCHALLSRLGSGTYFSGLFGIIQICFNNDRRLLYFLYTPQINDLPVPTPRLLCIIRILLVHCRAVVVGWCPKHMRCCCPAVVLLVVLSATTTAVLVDYCCSCWT